MCEAETQNNVFLKAAVWFVYSKFIRLLCPIGPILIEVLWFIVQVVAKKSTNPLEG